MVIVIIIIVVHVVDKVVDVVLDRVVVVEIHDGADVQAPVLHQPGDLPDGQPSQDEVIAAYRGQIDQLKAERGYATVDVISLDRKHPQKDELRAKFLDEHRHGEDEARFFVAGRGLFTLHIDDYVYAVLCEKNDLISVPAGTRHWFDMGEFPHFVAIRLFNNPEGWVASFTGDDIASRFPRLED